MHSRVIAVTDASSRIVLAFRAKHNNLLIGVISQVIHERQFVYALPLLLDLPVVFESEDCRILHDSIKPRFLRPFDTVNIHNLDWGAWMKALEISDIIFGSAGKF